MFCWPQSARFQVLAKKTGTPAGLEIFALAALEAISLQIHPCSQMTNLSAKKKHSRDGPRIWNTKASGLPSRWDVIMKYSFGKRREPRYLSRLRLALIMLSLARAMVGPAEPL